MSDQPTDPTAESTTFADLGLASSLIEGLEMMNFRTPTPVQTLAIPHIVAGKDLIGCAQTGTGKTAAYLLPIMHHLAVNHLDTNTVDALVLAPTRELAQQIDQQIEGFSYFTPISSAPIYGGGSGSSYEREKSALSSGANIIVATPGRLISHLNFDYANFSGLKYFILDEADRMLDMGFHEDIMKIISHLPPKRQNLLFSATMPKRIRDMASKLLTDPEEVNIAISKPAEKIVQAAFCTYEAQKIPLLLHLLKSRELETIIIFGSTKRAVKDVNRALKKEGFATQEIHSDLDQTERETVLRKFKNKEVKVLVATDIVSRGIDVENIDLVINYSVPSDPEDYVHRIGRTARAAKDGVAFTFINEDDMVNFSRIEKMIEREITKPPLPDHIGEGPAYDTSRRSGSGRQGGRSGGRSGGGNHRKGGEGKGRRQGGGGGRGRGPRSGGGGNG